MQVPLHVVLEPRCLCYEPGPSRRKQLRVVGHSHELLEDSTLEMDLFDEMPFGGEAFILLCSAAFGAWKDELSKEV